MVRRTVAAMVLVLAGCAEVDAPGTDDGGAADADTLVGRVPRSDAVFGGPDRPRADAGRGGRFDPGPDGPDAGDVRDAAPDAAGPLPPAADAGPPPPPPDDAAAPPPPPPRRDAAAAPPPRCEPEACNGLDDDCDGVVDNRGVCGPYVQSRCRLWLGWADRNRGPEGVSPTWGACPPQDRSQADANLRCTSTRGDGRFAQLDLNGDVGGDDQLGVALRCEDPGNAALAAWVQSHCAVFLGHADNRRGPAAGSMAWGDCPESVVGNVGDLRCTSTGFDGNFRRLQLQGDVDDNDHLGLAWLCRDRGDPDRASALTASVEVFLGHADDNDGPGDSAPAWGPCPQASQGVASDRRCIGTRGDGAFNRMQLTGDVDGNDDLGIALRARAVP